MFKELTRHTKLLAALSGACFLGTAAAVAAAPPIGHYTTKGAWSYVSEPGLHPPKLLTRSATVSNRLSRGLLFVTNFPNLTRTEPATGEGEALVGQSGPLILDNKLQPVWFHAVPTNAVAMNLDEQSYRGKPALSWWEGVITNTGATQSGEDVVLDQHYRHVATLKGAGGWIISPHEFIISGADAWVTAYKVVPNVDLSPYGGSANALLLDSAVQEYNLKSGNLLYSWDAYNPGGTPNIPLSEVVQPPPASPTVPWDAYHVNSIQLTGNGTFLASMRNTWAAYLVRKSTNQVVWTLGGKPGVSSFTFGPNAQFEWQHDVELHGANTVTVFDDHCCEIIGAGKFATPTGPSRGIVLRIDAAKHTATLVSQYTPPKVNAAPDAAFLGSMQLLSGGNALVGWGSTPFFTEYNKSGKVVLDVLWPGPDLSYRARLFNNWVGLPARGPSGAVHTKNGKATVYASWNGATRLVAWRVLGGSDAKHLSVVVTRASRSGFETAIALTRAYGKFEVQALDAKGHVLATSKAFGASKGGTSSPGGSSPGPPTGPGGY